MIGVGVSQERRRGLEKGRMVGAVKRIWGGEGD